MHLQESGEMYLESILRLSKEKALVRAIDVGEYMGYSKPSVSIAMKKLRESGYISMDTDGSITLNESGLEIASRIYGRHKTITRFFVLLGVDPAVAAEDACKVEHDLSDETFSRLKEFVERTEQNASGDPPASI